MARWLLCAMDCSAENFCSQLDQDMIVSILDWTMERFQDALLTEELDPGLFRRQGDPQEKKDARITQFLDVLKRAIGRMNGAICR